MKKICMVLIVLAVALLPCASTLAADAQEAPLVVGATTALSGAFFTSMWGNNTSDIDVRTLLHGYSPVVWTAQTLFEVDTSVVRDLTVGILENGNKLFTIELQEDMKFSDGTPIKAAEYVFSTLLQASPVIAQLGGAITGMVHIAGYDRYSHGETDAFTGVRLLDEYTYSIEVDAEYLPFFYEMAMIDCIPYPIDVIAPGCVVDDDGQGAFIRNADASLQEPMFTASRLEKTILDSQTGYLSHPKVTSGPYKLTSYDAQAHTAAFEINPHYRGNHEGQKPTIQQITLQNVLPETMAQALEDGEVDLLNKCVSADVIDEGLRMVTEGTTTSSNYPRMGFGFLSFACEQGPTQFESVRKAVAYALDADEFCHQYTSLNYGVPVYGYYGIGQWMVQMIEYPDAGTEGVDPDDTAEWGTLTLEGLDRYATDTQKAKEVLIADGWTLNSNGGTFVEGTDVVRHKQVDGTLMSLTLRYAKTQDNAAAQLLEDMLATPLAELGIAFVSTELPFTQVLEQYYSPGERSYDMMHLATNFTSVFDPYFVFNTDSGYDGVQNTTGYHDETLEQLALDMRQTESGDILGYCQSWLAFQSHWNDKLPMLPLYSNIYFDFYDPSLTNYAPDVHMNWPAAILYAEWNGGEA